MKKRSYQSLLSFERASEDDATTTANNKRQLLVSTSKAEEGADESKGEALAVLPCPCIRPPFPSQRVIDSAGLHRLDDDNSVILVHDFLEAIALQQYLDCATKVERFVGVSVFNSPKPRREVCYTIDGRPYRYSGITHTTRTYPEHVLQLIPSMLEAVQRQLPESPYRRLSNAVDILYGPEFIRGGSVGAHSDDEDDWGLVVIFSLGQTRWLRVRRLSDKKSWINVEMRHNSILAMHGSTFQRRYTHQVDKLSRRDSVHPRLSLNVRFLLEEDQRPVTTRSQEDSSST